MWRRLAINLWTLAPTRCATFPDRFVFGSKAAPPPGNVVRSFPIFLSRRFSTESESGPLAASLEQEKLEELQGGSGDFLETNHPGGVDPLQLKGCNSPDDLTSEDKLANIFESWIQEHGKVYKNSEEKLHRFEIFKDNIKDIDYQGCWLGLS